MFNNEMTLETKWRLVSFDKCYNKFAIIAYVNDPVSDATVTKLSIPLGHDVVQYHEEPNLWYPQVLSFIIILSCGTHEHPQIFTSFYPWDSIFLFFFVFFYLEEFYNPHWEL